MTWKDSLNHDRFLHAQGRERRWGVPSEVKSVWGSNGQGAIEDYALREHFHNRKSCQGARRGNVVWIGRAEAMTLVSDARRLSEPSGVCCCLPPFHHASYWLVEYGTEGEYRRQ